MIRCRVMVPCKTRLETLRYSGALMWNYFGSPQGESGKLRVDPTNGSRVYYLDPNSSDLVSPAARFVHSDEGGTSSWKPNWVPAVTGLPTVFAVAPNGANVIVTDYASFPGKRSIVIDPSNPKRLLLGLKTFTNQWGNNVTTPGSVFETTTGGDPNKTDLKFNGNGWRDIGSDLANNKVTISAIALAPSDPNTIFAGAEDGRVFKTTNAGNDCKPNCPTWTEVDNGLPPLFADQRVMDLYSPEPKGKLALPPLTIATPNRGKAVMRGACTAKVPVSRQALRIIVLAIET